MVHRCKLMEQHGFVYWIDPIPMCAYVRQQPVSDGNRSSLNTINIRSPVYKECGGEGYMWIHIQTACNKKNMSSQCGHDE